MLLWVWLDAAIVNNRRHLVHTTDLHLRDLLLGCCLVDSPATLSGNNSSKMYWCKICVCVWIRWYPPVIWLENNNKVMFLYLWLQTSCHMLVARECCCHIGDRDRKCRIKRPCNTWWFSCQVDPDDEMEVSTVMAFRGRNVSRYDTKGRADGRHVALNIHDRDVSWFLVVQRGSRHNHAVCLHHRLC